MSCSDVVSETTSVDGQGNERRVVVFANGTRIESVTLHGLRMIVPPARKRSQEMHRVTAKDLDRMCDGASPSEQEYLVSKWDEVWS